MTNTVQIVLTAILVAIVLAATYWLSGRLSQRRVEQDFDDPEEIATAVDVYLRYGRKQAARRLLESGLDKFPDHAALTERRRHFVD